MNEFLGLEEKTINICRELKPIGKTRSNIDKFKAMEDDDFIYKNKYVINDLLKKVAMEKVEKALKSISKALDFSEMFALMETLDEMQGEERKEVLQNLFAERIALLNELSTVLDFKFTNKKTIEVMLPEYVENHNFKNKDELMKMVEIIKPRQAKFERFEKNIDSLINMNLKKGSLSYRILVENPQIHLENVRLLTRFDYAGILREEPDEVISFCKNSSLDDYNSLLFQKNIDVYNYCVGVINQKLNEYCQQEKLSYSELELKTLRKLPLSERKSFFDKIPFFESDKELVESYNKLVTKLNNHSFNSDVLSNDLNIYIKSNKINNYSNIVYGKWNTINDCLEEYCNEYGEKKEKVLNNISVYDINNMVEEFSEKLEIPYYNNSLQQIIEFSFANTKYAKCDIPMISLRNDECKEKYEIKKNLDKAIEFIRLLRLFDTENENFSFDAKQEIEKTLEIYNDINLLYNMAKNYITQKGNNKIKKALSFSTSGFAGGWSESVENTKRVFLMKDDLGSKYLGIYNLIGCKANGKSVSSVSRTIKESLTEEKTEKQCYRKMVCSVTSDVKKSIPRLFVNSQLPEPELTRFKKKEYNDDEKFLAFIIDFIKEKIEKHETWKSYNFKYKEHYESYDEFCDDLQKQGYILKWKYIEKSIIDELVDNGCIYLFKISSKYDRYNFKKSIHEKYFDALFSDENENGKLIKLLGNAEVFYREPQIKNPYIHKKGSLLVNKHYDNGKTIGSEYSEIAKNIQGTTVDGIVTKICDRDIIKDERYTREQFSIHIPVKIGNISSKEKVDSLAIEKLKKPNNTVVITRSNNHFLYAVVFDDGMNVLEKRSLNVVKGVNYKEKLEIAEDLKKKDALSWKEIKSTSGLMDGYISYAIREVADLVLKYDAMVVLEKATANGGSFNLLSTRTYEKFKNALINKLQFLNDVSKKDTEPGGVLNPYNLTHVDKDKDFEKELNGIVLQIPAFYMAMKDINSEFVLLKSPYAKNQSQRKNLVNKFKNFNFNNEKNVFELEYDSKKFNSKYKNTFICDSFGERIIRQNGETERVNLTDHIKQNLMENGLDFRTGENLYSIYDEQNKSHINAIYESLKLILQMYNFDSNEAYYVSPVSHTIITDSDCREIVQSINLYKKAVELAKQYYT